MPRYDDIDPQDIDPDTNRPYPGYSSPALDTSFHDHEMDVDEKCSHSRLVTEECRQCEADANLRKTYPNGAPMFRADGMMLDDQGNRSVFDDLDDDGGCTDPRGHKWACTGTQYGGDDERWQGEGRCYCEHCGADGDG